MFVFGILSDLEIYVCVYICILEIGNWDMYLDFY